MEFDEYRSPWENDRHWEVKKQFLQFYRDFFPGDKLQCLAQVYSNIEMLQCSYPTEVMSQIQKLARHLKACKKVPENETPDSIQKDKRKIEEPESTKSKKLCESGKEKYKNEEKDKLEREENEKNECLPKDFESVDYKSLTQSENFVIVERLITEVQKLSKLQNENAYDLILSSALHLNIEDLVDFKYTQYSTQDADSVAEMYYCELFISTTKLGIGGGENRYIAKKEASDNALNTLLNLPLIEKLGIEAEKLLNEDHGETSYDILLSAALWLGIENLINLKFATRVMHARKADYTYEKVYCEFFVGATKIAYAFSNNKCAAKRKASNNALYILTHIKDLPSGNIEQVRVEWRKKCKQSVSKKSSSHGKWDRELLEKMAFEMKRETLKMQPVLLSIYACFTRIGRLNDLVFNPYKAPNSPGDTQPLFICDAFVNNVPMASGKATSKKKARTIAAENLMALFVDLFESRRKSLDSSKDVYADILCLIDKHSHETPFANCEHISINEKTRTVESKRSNIIPSAFFSPLDTGKAKTAKATNDKEIKSPNISNNFGAVNKRLYDNSIEQNLLLYDTSEIPSKWKLTHCSILSYSVHRCHRFLTCEYTAEADGTYKVDILIDHKVIGTGIAATKSKAKKVASRIIMEKLRKEIYTIKVKEFEEEAIEINPSDVINLRLDSKDGRRNWNSSSIDRKKITEKIICPGNKEFTKLFQHYADIAGRVNLSNICTKLATLLRGYSKSRETLPLKFSDKFLPKERKMILCSAGKFGLTHSKYQKNEDKSIYLRRKIGVKEVLDTLIKSGGKTSKYELVDLSN